MSTQQEIRNRIATVQSTRKITSAMKMVAASRLRKVQNQIIHRRQYAGVLKQVLDEVITAPDEQARNVYVAPRSVKDVIVISIGSNRGLCGHYNTFLIKHTLREVQKQKDAGNRVRVMPIGKKPAAFFEKHEIGLLAGNHDIPEKVSYETAAAFAEHIMELYLKEHCGRILLVYNRFHNAVVHTLTTEQVLPVKPDEMTTQTGNNQHYRDPSVIMEPTPDEVVDYLTGQFIAHNVYRILLDASASEHGSRMTAMHEATDNADELIRSLTLTYNKVRQASVTREIMDVMGGVGGGN